MIRPFSFDIGFHLINHVVPMNKLAKKIMPHQTELFIEFGFGVSLLLVVACFVG